MNCVDEPEQQRPLLLLVCAGSSEGQIWFVVLPRLWTHAERIIVRREFDDFALVDTNFAGEFADRLSGLVGCKVLQMPRDAHAEDGLRRFTDRVLCLALPTGSVHSI